MKRARMLSISSKVLKYLLAISVGITLRSFFDLPVAKTDFQTVQSCACVTQSSSYGILHSDMNLQLRESFIPQAHNEVINYNFFNSSVAIESIKCNHISGVRHIDKIDIAEVVSQVAAQISSQRSSQWRVIGLENAYRRLDPARGMEYLIDAELISEEHQHVERHRIQMIRPFGYMRVLADSVVDEQKMIHFIVAVYGASAEFYEFLAKFKEIHMQSEQHRYLMIVVCVNSTSEADQIRLAGTLLQRHYWHKLHVRVVQIKHTSAHALAFDIGFRQLPDSALVMTLDVGIQFSNDVLQRCQIGALEGQQVYYPVPFVQYMPNIVSNFSPQDEVQEFAGINKHTDF